MSRNVQSPGLTLKQLSRVAFGPLAGDKVNSAGELITIIF